MAATAGYDWAKEVEEFESTKAGVKGLVDSGITKIPRFFIYKSPSKLCENGEIQLKIPVIDLQGIEINSVRRKEIVEEIKGAAKNWGFFQIVYHGVPVSILDAILESTRSFHEQPKEDKMEWYSSDNKHKVRVFTINGSFSETHVANWRDALACTFIDGSLDPEAIPIICRKEIMDYMEYMIKVREILSELLSEALGLGSDYLAKMDCLKSEYLTCLYYPPCPEPELALGTINHSDSTFLTMVVQDSSGGLQVLHQNHWVDVPPIPGALVVNIGDLMQLITNDKFKSVEHRVLARPVGSRVSAACFFFPRSECMLKPYGPIKELLSEKDPPLYKSVSNLEYMAYYQKNVRECTSALPHFKL
ncbi:1-aminocyclopropane-1-carboxylate oxidase homolog [Lycium ferocissimum]|uniref:1-aminocyclopropane-1-carboxylate oxidase homolog n=1 Tax=Lycium ferocissimum TaxID=112874 RepID=UPI002814E1D0|nr:1-aminocyclopropane-1-carboxylate oxidase homolog [Lycium ferocissimum]